jgi:uncharacterized protein
MAKPSGSACNLDCSYCFYLEKEKLYPQERRPRMSRPVLEAYIRQTLASQPGPEVRFTWQGGEPTLMGLDFYKDAVALQRALVPPGWTVHNAFQTNGLLLDEAWCAFFAAEGFLVGISIDGPRDLHDRHRVDKGQQPTFDRVVAAVARLKAHGVPFNTLTVVGRENAQAPERVYDFLVDLGATVLQFIPLVERQGVAGLLAGPPQFADTDPAAAVTPWSVLPEDWGAFLVTVFDRWSTRDIGRVQVQLFEVMLGISMGLPSTMCLFTEKCGKALVLEHNGDVYSCDHYVYPETKLGNLLQQDLGELVDSPAQRRFGSHKAESLPRQCLRCPVRQSCQGECPKHRFLTSVDGEPGLNYLCAGYLRFLLHAETGLRLLGGALRSGAGADAVMREFQRQQRALAAAGGSRPCPCGSGRKFKRCCGQAPAP